MAVGGVLTIETVLKRGASHLQCVRQRVQRNDRPCQRSVSDLQWLTCNAQFSSKTRLLCMSIIRKTQFCVGFRLLVHDLFSVVLNSFSPRGVGHSWSTAIPGQPVWSRSKLLHLPPVPKISLISMSPDGGRIRY